jgi:hypothetical protein
MRGKKIMLRQSILWRTALVLSPILFLCGTLAETSVGYAKTPRFTVSAAAVQARCAATTDAEIVAAIQEKIKADKRFDGRRNTFNVSSRKRVVTLRGEAYSKAEIRDLGKLALTTKCVRKVNNKVMWGKQGGCPPGLKECGEVCIGKDEDCNMMPPE